jgi:hypothetical protein
MAKEIDLVSMAKKALEASASAADDDDLDEDVEEVETGDAEPEGGDEEEDVEEPAPAAKKQAKEKQEEVKSTFLRDYLKSQLKIDISDDLTDEDIAPQLIGLAGENRKLQEEANYYKQLASKQSQEAPERKTAAPQPEEKKSKWSSMDYDPDWEKAAEFDPETRQWVAKSKFGTWGVEAAGKLNEYTRHQTDRARRLTTDPFGAVREAGLDEYLSKYREDLLKEVREQQQAALREWSGATQFDKERESMEKFFVDNRKDYFKTDADGEVLTDMNGDAVLTDRGKSYRAAVIEAREELGITHPRKVHQYALKVSAAAYPVTKTAPTNGEQKKTATERNKEQKKKFLERGRTKSTTRLAGRDGSVRSARERGDAQNRGLSFREMVLQDPDNAEVLGSDFQG